DQPTAGVDVGTKEEIYVFLRRLAAAGSALIMISDDPEELSRVCDRILIMRRGRIVQELCGDAASGDVLTAVTGDY
ncbi:MAG: sugar ABC transporter ATP-binding protein, partial [Firmicutes bacterium]|nr:sugar ABC transporter ATP-binding protein [Bacillota bacterium]